MTETWTIDDLNGRLQDFERELRLAGLSASTVHTYVDRAERFLRYLTGEYIPGRG